ncbi:MAG: DUF192 domain-containing protein [Bdellovibrionaceae bacterium]|nr:DUF192 domain-containing protein [Pseudobdellovibrionaceae bacterium]
MMRWILCFSMLLSACSGREAGAKTSRLKTTEQTPSPEAARPASPGFATRKISIGRREIVVEVADNDERRSYGLMFRTSLPEDDGMLFIFDDEQIRRFWMKNTRIPLSIAYINSKKEIIDILNMQPAAAGDPNPPLYSSRGPATYALEMNLGWFDRNQIKVGDSLRLH